MILENFNQKLNTKEGRAFLHEKLLSFARSSNTNATHPGLNKFIRSIKDPQLREIACAWLVKFSPLRKYQIEGNAVFGVETKLVGKYDMGVAALNPYYSMELKITSSSQKTSSSSIQQSTHQLSDTQFRHKTIKLALNNFLDSPSLSGRDRLIQLINNEPMSKSSRGGSFFVQGGAIESKR
jgi:hypothetical protein